MEQNPAPATDPVCGMSVDPPVAEGNGLVSRQDATTYYFCGRGCKLEFEEDPGRYLAPN